MRSPLGPATCTLASSAASATHMSEGCVAMQASLVPRMACMRLRPLMAEQLLRGAGKNRACEQRIALRHQRMIGEIGIRHERADAYAAVACFLDVVERQ